MSWQSFKERWQAEETKIGKLLKSWIAYGLGIIATLGHLLQSTDVIAVQQYVDPVVFKIMGGCAIFSAFVGKLTKKESFN